MTKKKIDELKEKRLQLQAVTSIDELKSVVSTLTMEEKTALAFDVYLQTERLVGQC